ncbi:hypothetical protein [Georgenia muralis]|uniref:Uncharacterized protein n=1 Tax=Georgenia muralis TaxID=154117 RepID=A0A3N4ZA55_9MICO|nr:hypothetical protein [Georgenia muralis]RPF29003.1 hypothetical protein EDD32_3554 [Georgenia muralis]
MSIAFEEGRTDVVTAVVTLMDGATRRPVRGDVDVALWDVAAGQARPVAVVRNLSGQAVVLNAPPGEDLTFRFGTERSIYRGPVLLTVNPAADGVRHVVALERRPDAPFDDVATLVRGVVVRSPGGAPVPVEGAAVSAAAPGPGRQFPATTDERGAFALVVELRPPAPDEPAEIDVVLTVTKDGLPTRTLAVQLQHGRHHVFTAPIDLDDAVVPPIHVRAGP